MCISWSNGSKGTHAVLPFLMYPHRKKYFRYMLAVDESNTCR